MLMDDRRPDVEPDVVREEAEPGQAPPVVVVRNTVADALSGFGGDLLDGAPYFLKLLPGNCTRCLNIGVHSSCSLVHSRPRTAAHH